MIYAEFSRGISNISKTLLPPTSPATTTPSRIPKRNKKWDEVQASWILHRGDTNVTYRGRDVCKKEKDRGMRKVAPEKTNLRVGERRRAASRRASPNFSRHGAPVATLRRSAVINASRAKGDNIRIRKRAQADPLASDEEGIVDGAGGRFSGVHSKSRRIMRSPTPPRLYSRSYNPFPHYPGPLARDCDRKSGRFPPAAPASAIECESEDTRVHVNELSRPALYFLISCLRCLLDWGWRLWSLHSNGEERVPFSATSPHAQHVTRENEEDLDVLWASDASSDTFLDEYRDHEELEVEAELYTPPGLDSDTLCGSCEDCDDIDVEDDNRFCQKRNSRRTFSGRSEPGLCVTTPDADDSPGFHSVRRAIVAKNDCIGRLPRTRPPTARVCTIVQEISKEGDLTIPVEEMSEETLFAHYAFPRWRHYRFEEIKRYTNGMGALRNERRIFVPYSDEAAIEAELLQGESDMGALEIEWGSFDQEVTTFRYWL